MTKAKKMALLFPHLIGKKIRIFTGIPSTHWAIADAISFTGLYLIIKNVEIWNGEKKEQDDIHAQWIKKIEIITQ